ncbi:MAG: dienelactone hydrolase family protein [Candidatus Hydrogenedentes bacterium]|nr:dienelactone hydrolase family protein [Candidatus Hydrogenedentota bacterium]
MQYLPRRKVWLIFLAACPLLLWGCPAPDPADPHARGWHFATLEHGGLTRHFRYYVPAHLTPAAPTVLLLHGGSQSMNKLFRRGAGGTQEWPMLAEEEGFLLLVPNGVNAETGDAAGNHQQWNDCRQNEDMSEPMPTSDDVGFIAAMLDWAEANFDLDSARVYATGASNGGLMSYRLGMELPGRIAAIVVFVANLPAHSECAPPEHPVPIMIVNGTDDPLMPYNGGEVGPGHRGPVLSTEATLQAWLQVNGLDAEDLQTTPLPDTDPADGSRIVQLRYDAEDAPAEVVLYRVEGGGHALPSIAHPISGLLVRTLLGPQNHDLEGARAAWEFLKNQRLQE